MFRKKSMSGVRDVRRGGVLATRLANIFSKSLNPEAFEMRYVLADACRAAGIPEPANTERDVPHYRWWNKLCKACGEKKTTRYGGQLLRFRLTNSLAQRLAIEDAFRLNGADIEREEITQPTIVLGLPRSNGHMAAHVLSRTGLFTNFNQADTMSPSVMSPSDRDAIFARRMRGFGYINPDWLCVRVPVASQIDDDLSLHLLTPQSYAWGLLHGLDAYLLECIEEDQEPVYAQLKRTMKLFQWYRRCGFGTSSVEREIEPINNPIELQRYGEKSPLMNEAHPPWLLYSPFAILSSQLVNETFPDMKVVWVHRALAQCVPSLCSALCLHNALYTGKPPSETQLALMGEKVLGIFGSGAENAVQYYSQFDQRRMVHWSNRDVKRSASRLVGKTLQFFNTDLDRYRRIQMINGQTEYFSAFRPLHDAQMPYFCLHDGIIGDVFSDYIYQFEEYAFEKRLGVTIKQYQSLTDNHQGSMMSLGAAGGGTGRKKAPSLGANQPTAGDYMQGRQGL